MTDTASVPADDPHAGALSTRPIQVTLVTSTGCHFCREADQLLEQLQEVFPLRIERKDLNGAEGAAIARRWRVPFPPVLLLDGKYHGHGRISKRKLTRALTRLIDQED